MTPRMTKILLNIAAPVLALVAAFAITTILTMLTIVYLAVRGLERVPLKSAERYTHALAGAALSLCGLGIVFGL